MRLRWTHSASRDLELIEEHISRDNPGAAVDAVLEIIRQAELLTDYPDMGRVGRVDGTRELVIVGLPYVVPYTYKGNELVVIRVLHGAMKWPTHF